MPLVIAGGLPEKVARIRALLPDAVYTDWDHAGAAIRAAIKNPPARPVTPGAMAAYTETSLPRKLGITASSAVALLGAPPDFARKLEPLPEGVRILTRGTADRLLLFTTSLGDLRRRFPTAARRVKPGGGLWIVWPKRGSGVPADLTQAVVRRFGIAAGWVDYKICSVDETWSGLLFARRRQAE